MIPGLLDVIEAVVGEDRPDDGMIGVRAVKSFPRSPSALSMFTTCSLLPLWPTTSVSRT
ncbi:MAG TPA: hypothetical protein VLW85_12200 [Myxococcales bacterium]|nr:hypothetical protein [Myxococcales bacterium]